MVSPGTVGQHNTATRETGYRMETRQATESPRHPGPRSVPVRDLAIAFDLIREKRGGGDEERSGERRSMTG